MKGILPLVALESGCDYHRVILPLKYLGVDIDSFLEKQIGEVIQDTKVLYLNRVPHIPMEMCLNMRKEFGIKIVVDLDDYWLLHPRHILYKGWDRSKMAEQIVESLKMADVVICTTSLLADKIKPLNNNIHVIPNALPFGHEQFVEERTPFEDGIRFIYAGGSTHLWDIKELKVPFTKVNNNPALSKAYFNLAGFHDSDPTSKNEWTKIENNFNLLGKLKNYTRYNTLSINKYMNHYNNADVSLVPLEYNNFNRFKSNLKIIEAGCKNIPVICSAVEPYINEPNKKIPGLNFAKNAREWYDIIWFYTMNPRTANEHGLALGEYVREHYDLIKVNEYRKQLLENLIS